MIYEWAPGADFDASAQRVGEQLNRLFHGAQEIDPSRIVEDARRPRSPLHPCFKWDAQSAIERDLLRQADDLVKSIRVVLDDSDTTEPMYVRVRRSRRTVFIPFADAKRIPADVDFQRTQARRALATWVSQFGHLPRTKRVVTAAGAFLNQR
jgi:hypothetical protein